ncbi:MAG TPA: RHS repeat-associated core domain-containing protein [Pseudoalteromonas prydzensis]|uniref:RHS repeat-associated core domain-containing protein n=2 Tax=Pseudoalteromonas prydzensis TaxID=182141 RepID=A0A7V1D1D2_9GAMM|nr:RHS repeat-associated core domain-containing protein [Pseudoalteromonas prydzensis]
MRNKVVMKIFKYVILFTLTLIISSPAYTLTAEDYKGASENYSKVDPYKSNGENINPLNGQLSYESVDMIIPGSNGMDILISRSFSQNERVWGYNGQIGSMSNWRLEVPRIIIPTVPYGITRGWDLPPDKAEYDKLIDKTATTRTGICNDPYPGDGRASTRNSGGIKIAKKYWSGMTLKIPGQAAQQLFKNTDMRRYPSKKWVTTNDWVASCTNDGNGFIVESPTGISYTIDIVQALYSYVGLKDKFNHTGNTTLFASEVRNIHGTVINYDYETFGKFFMPKNDIGQNASHIRVPYIEQRLTKIRRNDDTNILIDYYTTLEKIPGTCMPDGTCHDIVVTPASFNERIKSVEVQGGDRVMYGYYANPGDNRYYLNKVLKGNKTWKYKYGEGTPKDKKSYRDEGTEWPVYNGPRLLTEVTLPGGGSIEYTYKVFKKMRNDPYNENMKLQKKVINDGTTNIDTWIFNYEDDRYTSNDGSYNSKDVIKTTIVRGLDKTVQLFSDDKSFDHGRLLQETTKSFDTSKTFSVTKEVEYTYGLVANIGDFTFLDFPEEVSDSLTSKVKLTKQVITQDGNDYITKYISHDLYGKPTKVQETFNERSKFTKLSYHNETENSWLLGLPTTIQVSDTDSNYLTVSETIYHNDSTSEGAYAGLGLPYEQREFGRWVKRFTEYDSKGNLAREEYNIAKTTGEGNQFTSYSRYKRGIARTVSVPARNAAGEISKSLTVDNNGRVTKEIDFNGVTTKFSYAYGGSLQGINYAEDSITGNDWYDTLYTWDFTTATSPKRIIEYCNLNKNSNRCDNTSVHSITETYDGLMRLKTLEETDGDKTRSKNYKYDKNGKQIFESYWSSSNGISTTYDGLSRVLKVAKSGLGEANYAYLQGNKIQLTDAENNTTTTTYQAFGSPSYERAIEIKSPESVTTTIEIDVFGLTHSIAQEGLTKAGAFKTITENRYYDEHKQLCLTTRPDVRNTLYKHNALGKLVWSKAGVTNTKCSATQPVLSTSFSYDNLGELQTIDYPDNSGDVTYERDNNGNVKTLTAGNVIHRYEYNNQNLLEEEQLYIGTQLPLTLKYTYNDLQQNSHLSYPDGTVVNFKPNSFGEPTEAQTYKGTTVALSFAKSATYYANGLLNSFTYGNGVKHETTIHSDSLLPKQLKDTGPSGSNLPSTVMSLTYDYDNNANVTSINDGQNSAYSLTDLQYDGLDRLTSTTGGSGIGSSSLRYDGFGNITYYQSKGKTLDYTYDYAKNRLSKVTGVSGRYGSIRYDDRGNIEYNGAYSLDFNAANQLTTAKGNSYLYDGHNRRVKQTDGNGTSYSMYSQDGMLLYREKGNIITGNGTNYIYLGKKLIAKYGNVTPQSVDESRQHSRPFGETIEAPKDDVGYTGHKFDTDLGLSYMQARYYDPVIGRFYSNDPVDFSGHQASGNAVHGFNRYAYANNNPHKFIDPSGEEPIGINVGGGFTFFGKGSASSMILFDSDTLELAYVANNELGGGAGKGVGLFWNAVWTSDDVTIDDFGGYGLALSGSGSIVNGSIGLPASHHGVDAARDIFNGKREPTEGIIREFGLSLGVGAEAGITGTYGEVYKTDVLADIVTGVRAWFE